MSGCEAKVTTPVTQNIENPNEIKGFSKDTYNFKQRETAEISAPADQKSDLEDQEHTGVPSATGPTEQLRTQREPEVTRATEVTTPVTTRLWVFSDPHIDVGHNRAPFRMPEQQPDADVLVVAGDIREGLRQSIVWLAHSTGWTKPIVYVAGNHDFYRTSIDGEREKAAGLLDRINTGRKLVGWGEIHVLQDSRVDINGVRFIGSTLWTDYELDGYGWRDISMLTANDHMSDHKLIRVAKDNYRKFLARDALKEHLVSRQYIHNQLLEPFAGKKVVVTHHAPSIRSIAPEYVTGASRALNPAYASKLEFMAGLADLWVHGHMHNSFDYELGFSFGPAGRVIANPRGYHGSNEKFNPSLVVTV